MRKRIAVVGIFLVIGAAVLCGGAGRPRPPARAPDPPEYRKVGGVVYRVSEGTGWVQLKGRVINVGLNFVHLMDDDFKVVQVQGSFAVADGDNVRVKAFPVGFTSYVTVLGATKTIRTYDYGVPCDPPKVEESIEESVRASFREAQAQAREQQNAARLLLWIQRQATNGSPAAQFDLGCRYRDGLGVETNLWTARLWLSKAAAQGHAGASNALRDIRP